MTDLSDVDLALIYSDETDIKEEKKKVYRNRHSASCSADFLFYTTSSLRASLDRGGIAEEIMRGKVIFEQAKVP